MKKTLIIRLVGGKPPIARDITNEKIAPIGAPVNHPHFAALCQTIAQCGYTDTTVPADTMYSHIAPSQIESVSITFEK